MNQKLNTIRVGLIGQNIDYSNSPAVFNKWFNDYDNHAQFDLLDWPELSLKKFLTLQNTHKGVCITIPYKQELFNLLKGYEQAVITETAFATGAINAIVFGEGKVFAYNTDAMALSALMHSSTILMNFKTYTNKNPLTVLILGAGGAAAASTWALEQWSNDVQIPIQILSMNRSLKSIKGKQTIDLNKHNLKDLKPQIFINATPLGAGRNVEDDMNFKNLLTSLKTDDLKGVVDWAYGEDDTVLSALAHQNAVPVVLVGKSLLYEQARYNYQLWFDRLPL